MGLKTIDTVLRYGPAAVDLTFAGLAAKHVPDQWKEYQKLLESSLAQTSISN